MGKSLLKTVRIFPESISLTPGTKNIEICPDKSTNFAHAEDARPGGSREPLAVLPFRLA
jgi:multisubunit Na+/H+ antiporter MnhE subunit